MLYYNHQPISYRRQIKGYGVRRRKTFYVDPCITPNLPRGGSVPAGSFTFNVNQRDSAVNTTSTYAIESYGNYLGTSLDFTFQYDNVPAAGGVSIYILVAGFRKFLVNYQGDNNIVIYQFPGPSVLFNTGFSPSVVNGEVWNTKITFNASNQFIVFGSAPGKTVAPSPFALGATLADEIAFEIDFSNPGSFATPTSNVRYARVS